MIAIGICMGTPDDITVCLNWAENVYMLCRCMYSVSDTRMNGALLKTICGRFYIHKVPTMYEANWHTA